MFCTRSGRVFGVWFAFCSSLFRGVRRSRGAEDGGGRGGVSRRICCCCCWVGVFRGVFWVELSLLGVLLGVPSPFQASCCLWGGLSLWFVGGVPLPLGDVGSDVEIGGAGGSGVVEIIPLLGLWILRWRWELWDTFWDWYLGYWFYRTENSDGSIAYSCCNDSRNKDDRFGFYVLPSRPVNRLDSWDRREHQRRHCDQRYC